MKVNGVDGADRLRFRTQLIQQWNDRLFAGMGDVESCKSLLARSLEQLRQTLEAKAELLQIDQFVGAGETLRLGFCFMQGRRLGSLNAAADEPKAADRDACR